MTTGPQKLGRYEVLEQIGKGAMGIVYLARDPLIGRLVALKTFRIGFAARDEELVQFRSRFVREAQSAGILSHPSIVTIHDVVDEGVSGICFIAMEYVKGTNLKQLLQRPDPFPIGFVIDVVSQVADALDYAHSRGVVHRDIKPANILITPDNRVKITDFGIARLESSNLTMEGQLLGTPNYMAPEQIQGKEIDHRADIFSLGVVFYEMLTRKKPFQGENMTAVTHKIVFDAFRPAEEIVKDLPKGLSAVLARCLEKDPNRRFARAAEIARELQTVLQSQQTLDDTVATQEVEPVVVPPEPSTSGTPPVDAGATRLVARPPLPQPPTTSGTSETAAPASAPADMGPTRLVERPPLLPPPGGPPPSAAVAPPAPPEDMGPTRLIERPPVPPPPASSEAGAWSGGPADLGKTRRVARPAPPSSPARRADAPGDEGKTRRVERPPVPEVRAAVIPSSAAAGQGEKGTAGSPVSTTARTVLSPRPPISPAGAPATGVAAPASQAPTPARPGWAKWVFVGAGAVVLFLLGLAWALSGPKAAPSEVPAPVAPVTTPEQQSRVTAAAAIAEARTHLAQGEVAAALQAVARAELAEPGNPETAALREEIESRQQEIEQADHAAKVNAALKVTRYAYGEHRYADAIAAGRNVLAIDPSNAEATRLISEAQVAIGQLKERREQIAAAQEREAEPAPAAPTPVATPVANPIPANEAHVHIMFASASSEGVLTIYAGSRQILREPFKFVRKTGFLLREKTSGTMEATRKLKPGPLTFLVYVALPGKPTRAISIESKLAGGSSRTLKIQVDEEGHASAALN